MELPAVLHLDLDGAWRDLPLPRQDASAWGPNLRFTAPSRAVEKFAAEMEGKVPPFLIFGSGDFHHLSALWIRQIKEPFTLVSFDNHPDWDVRPPRWACGGWINRALELPQVKRVAVWGCGNCECWGLHQFFGNRGAEQSGRLQVHPWADGRPKRDVARRGAILRSDWKRKFELFVGTLRGTIVYVTIDLDCLKEEFALTNWENGRFTLEDLRWALALLRNETQVIAGDICGAYSQPVFARRKQRFAANWDHPRFPLPNDAEIARRNRTAFDVLWPALAQ